MSKGIKALIIASSTILVAAIVAICVILLSDSTDGKKEKDKKDGGNSSISSMADASFKEKIQINHSYIATSNNITVAVKNDGTVIASGATEHFIKNTDKWSNIVSVGAGTNHVVGLKSDGTVVASGMNDYGQCDVSGWSDITCIAVNNYYTLGVKKDGTVLATGKNDNGQCDVSDWTDIVTVSTSGSHTLGLKSDGTVVAAGLNEHNQCRVEKWKNIISVNANIVGEAVSTGLKADGSLVCTRSDIAEDPLDLSDFDNLSAFFALPSHFIGVQKDGTVIALGYVDDCYVIESWTDVVFYCGDARGVIGLKADGTIVVSLEPKLFYINDEEEWFGIRTTPHKDTPPSVQLPEDEFIPDVSQTEPETEPATEFITEPATEIITEPKTEKPTKPSAPPAANYIEATNDDMNSLLHILSTMFTDFNRNDSDAVENAYDLAIGVFGSYRCFFDDEEYVYGSPDPLSCFQSSYNGSYEYNRYKAENVDWIVKNVYGIEPDHNLKVLEYNGESVYMYYYDGYYYVAYVATGMAEYFGDFVEKDVDENGVYDLKIEVLVPDDELVGYKYVKARLKMVDGEKVWEIIEIENDLFR